MATQQPWSVFVHPWAQLPGWHEAATAPASLSFTGKSPQSCLLPQEGFVLQEKDFTGRDRQPRKLP